MNTRVLPEEKRINQHIQQNGALFRCGARVMDQVLGENDYLVENRFTIADIIASFTVKWGQSQGSIDDFAHLQAYLDRLAQREHSTLGVIGKF